MDDLERETEMLIMKNNFHLLWTHLWNDTVMSRMLWAFTRQMKF